MNLHSKKNNTQKTSNLFPKIRYRSLFGFDLFFQLLSDGHKILAVSCVTYIFRLKWARENTGKFLVNKLNFSRVYIIKAVLVKVKKRRKEKLLQKIVVYFNRKQMANTEVSVSVICLFFKTGKFLKGYTCATISFKKFIFK